MLQQPQSLLVVLMTDFQIQKHRALLLFQFMPVVLMMVLQRTLFRLVLLHHKIFISVDHMMVSP